MDALIMHHFYHSIVNFDVTRSLYIQALLAMQAANEYTDGLSYFQLAVLASYAQKIAKTYISTLYPAYQAAADNLRIPFWDWGVSPSMPSIINVPTVSIVLPSGTTTYVNNPLFRYNFQNKPLNQQQFPPGDSDGYMAQYNWTVRNPDYSGDGQSDFNAANMNLENAGLGDQVVSCFLVSSSSALSHGICGGIELRIKKKEHNADEGNDSGQQL
ncbi:hypothetical protein ACHAPC_004450 [Botrytis cinerea]